MKNSTKVTAKGKPDTFINLGNNYWIYNYNIQEEHDEEGTFYSYIPIRIWGKPSYSKCAEIVIRAYISQNQEFDLINSANKYLMGVQEDETVMDKYKEYLILLSEIKSRVREDLNNSII